MSASAPSPRSHSVPEGPFRTLVLAWCGGHGEVSGGAGAGFRRNIQFGHAAELIAQGRGLLVLFGPNRIIKLPAERGDASGAERRIARIAARGLAAPG
jgi:hypothetical protein